MTIGIIVATKLERDAFYRVFGKPAMKNLGTGAYEIDQWILMDNKKGTRFIYLIMSGLGEIAAASATQHLIDVFAVDKVINYGVVGSLSEKHQERKVGVVTSIVHYDFDISFGNHYEVGEYPGKGGAFLKPKGDAIPASYTQDLDHFVCASADKLVGGGEPKRKLRREFGADICEMEAAGIVLTCNRNNIPCTFIKAISDGVDEDEEAFDDNANEASEACVRLIVKCI